MIADVKCSKPPRFGQCLVTGVVALSIFGSMICCCKNRIIWKKKWQYCFVFHSLKNQNFFSANLFLLFYKSNQIVCICCALICGICFCYSPSKIIHNEDDLPQTFRINSPNEPLLRGNQAGYASIAPTPPPYSPPSY